MAGAERSKAQSPAASTASASTQARDEQLASKLLDPNVELNFKTKIVLDLRESVDHFGKEQHASFVRHLLPALMAVLKTGPISFQPHSTEYKYRHTLLGTLHRLSSSDVFRSAAPEMASLCIQLMRNDAEGNAVLAVKVIVDLFRAHKDVLQSKAADVIQGILDIYASMPNVVRELFDQPGQPTPQQSTSGHSQQPASSDAPTPPPPSAATAGNAQTAPPGQKSFTILWEAPIAIVFLFQSYKELVNTHAALCLPHCFEFLQLHPEAQDAAHQQAEANGQVQLGPCAALEPRRQAFSDYVNAQVKTVSFVAYVLRSGGMGEMTAQWREALPRIILRLFKDLPVESSQYRKDMLIASRHLISTELRLDFLPFVDQFMDEHILLGTGITAQQSLRSLSLTVCADVVHHLRADLNVPQLNKVIHKLCCHIHDLALPFHHQTMCCRVLSQLCTVLIPKHQAGSPEERETIASLYQLMLETFLRKIEGLAEVRSEWPAWLRRRPPPDQAGGASRPLDEVDVERRKVVDAVYAMTEPSSEAPLKDARILFRSSCIASKSVLSSIKQVQARFPDAGQMARFFAAGTRCMSMFEYSPRLPDIAKQEIKETFDTFSELFIPMDVLSFSALWEVEVMYRSDHPKKLQQEANKASQEKEKDESDRSQEHSDVPTPAASVLSIRGPRTRAASAAAAAPASTTEMEVDTPATPATPAEIRPQPSSLPGPSQEAHSTQPSSSLQAPPERPAKLLDIFIEEALYSSPELSMILQSLLSAREFSHCFVGILLRHLVTLLPSLGSREAGYGQIVIRLFKLTFMTVTVYPEVNESVLLPHVGEIMLESLKFASQSSQPWCYYLLLRNLFRSIGGGRFEQIFKAVLPLLHPMLEQLQTLLNNSEGSTRDLFVELCLTVPVRLSVLLPYLGYLMKPLKLALAAGPELMAQGLRTLELCVDNLTHDFLNPFLQPFLDDVLSALWKLLKPSPLISPPFSHQALRILGKLGGRSRSLIGRPKLKWRQTSPSEEALLPIQFDHKFDRSVPLRPLVELAVKTLRRGDEHYRSNAFTFLKHASALFLKAPTPGDCEDVFGLVIGGLFDSAQAPTCGTEAGAFVVNYVVFVLKTDLVRQRNDGRSPNQLAPLTALLLDSLTENLAASEGKGLTSVVELTSAIVARYVDDPDLSAERTTPVIQHFASRLGSLCYDQSRKRKMGGLAGLQLLVEKMADPVTGNAWLQAEEATLIRSLLFMIKDSGSDAPPAQAQQIKDFFALVLRQSSLPLSGESHEAKSRLTFLTSLFMMELPSQSAPAREAAQLALGILAERLSTTPSELLMPVRNRLLLPIFNKPLRALAFHMQIGHIDALTYLLSLSPPLVEFGEPRGGNDQANGSEPPSAQQTPQMQHQQPPQQQQQSQSGSGDSASGTQDGSVSSQQLGAGESAAQSPAVSPGQGNAAPPRPQQQPSGQQQAGVSPFAMTRLLVEVIGIADAEDAALVAKPNPHKSADLLAQLRIVCIRFLSAALGTAELQSPRHNHTRSRILSVNFKLLYKPRRDTVDAAYNCLKGVVSLQSKLPKDMLQAGLRPILTNLADARKLDVACLDGLARLLELLNNYFKVEIGAKLLEHFRTLSSDLNALASSAVNPSSEHAELRILAGIVNIFRLLPHPAAGMFLPDLCKSVVFVENALKRCGPTVFTEPLAKYLDRYPVEGAEFFFQRMPDDAPFARTFQSIVASSLAPNLRQHLISTATARMSPYFGPDPRHPPQEHEPPRQPWRGALHTAQILLILCRDDPTWVKEQTALIGALVSRWVSPVRKQALESRNAAVIEQLAEDDVVLEIFYLTAHVVHVDVLFHVIEFLSTPRPADTSKLRQFVNRTVIKSTDVHFKTIVLDRFFDIFENPTFPRPLHEIGLRHVINPMLLIATNRSPPEEILSADCLSKLGSKVWQQAAPQLQQKKFSAGLRIELMLLTSLLARHRQIPDNYRSMSVKFGVSNGTDYDALVQQVSHGVIVDFTTTWASEIPFRVLLKLYGQLLKAHGAESRYLAKGSLDQLAVIFTGIANEIKSSPADDASAEKQQQLQQQQQAWVKSTRLLLIEEGLTQLTQLIHILHFIVRNPDLFFSRRDQFVSLIVVSLPRLSTSASATTETRILALELYALLLKWEQKRVTLIQSETQSGAAMDVDAEETEASPAHGLRAPAPSSNTAGGSAYLLWQVPASQRDTIVHTLMKMTTHISDPNLRSQNLLARAMHLLRGFLAPDIFHDINVRLGTFVPLRNDVTSASLPLFLSSAEILCIVIEQRPDEWVLNHLPILQQFLEKGISNSFDEAHEALAPAFTRIFRLLRDVPTPKPPQDPTSGAGTAQTESAEESGSLAGNEGARQLLAWATNFTEQALTSQQNSLGAVALLMAMSKSNPERIDPHLNHLMRLLNKIVKEHLSGQVAPDHADLSRKLIESCIHLLSLRVTHLGEQRRWLLGSLIQLADRSPSIPLCRFMLGLMSGWIFDSSQTVPSTKDLASILLKMTAFENRPDPSLLHDYLQLILRIYRSPSFRRSELTVKLENAFLIGCRSRDPALRTQFLQLFDEAVSRSVFTRLHYILDVQNWEMLAENWLHQALDLLLGAASKEVVLFKVAQETAVPETQQQFAHELASLRSGDLLGAARRLIYADPHVTQELWIASFKVAWTCMSKREQSELTKFSINLLAKDYHIRAVDRQPNPVQGVLAGLQACKPAPSLPAHLVRHLGRTFNVWFPAIELLQDAVQEHNEESPSVEDAQLDALAEMYADLAEDDYFYGLWRRRAFYPETNVALSFEQAGMWQQAQLMYESAQTKARSGTVSFSEAEYNIWEDHWVLCGSKLQQWDILYDLAKHEGNADLLLDCSWRLSDWQKDRESVSQTLQSVSTSATPRRKMFDVFLSLLKSHEQGEREHFVKNIQAGMDLCLRKWYSLPDVVGPSHHPLLHTFQQFIELQEAAQVFSALAMTNAANLDQRSQELKSILVTWRERLPNEWDDINIWSDIVSWRQHVFQAVNNTYLPLLPQDRNGPGANAPSYAYRGYHETAWIINRFAHVSRKHHLMDVCIASLNKIYTLPNIEIQEAFLKLREQAKCCYETPADLGSGLEVINNTNLQFFSNSQKAEFFTLKAMFLAKVGHDKDAVSTFSSAITLDMGFAKAWAQWGEFHDRLFKSQPTDLSHAANAVSCYLQAAGLYKNGKVRKWLVRILWLLSLDDAAGTVAKSFESFKGEVPTWYWVSFIPQLLLSLSHREAKYARIILMKIARAFPQALFYQLRTCKEEQNAIRKQWLAGRAAAEKAKNANAAPEGNGDNSNPSANVSGNDGDTEMVPPSGSIGNGPKGPQSNPVNQQHQLPPQAISRHPWDFIEEITSILKTAFPMLALTMETMGDQVVQRFKPAHDEESRRILGALCNDAVQQLVNRGVNSEDDCMMLPPTLSNISRFVETMNLHPLVKHDYEKHLRGKHLKLTDFVKLLQRWRDLYESILDHKGRKQTLESTSHWLVEFPYHKLDDVEVPGQYLKNQDNAQGFVKIAHFQAKYDLVRVPSGVLKRIVMVGHDGSLHPFAIQVPSPRPARREERIGQFFRLLNGPLSQHKDTRRRRLEFNVPVSMPISAHVRLVQNDASIVSLHDIQEQYCKAEGMERETPVIRFVESVRSLHAGRSGLQKEGEVEAARLESYNEVALKYLPDDVLKKYMSRTMPTASDLWHARKQATLDLAAFIFMTYTFFMGARCPSKIHLSRSTGRLHTSETLATFSNQRPDFANAEPVPFRFTPSLQQFLTAIGTEGVLTNAVLAIARALLEREDDLEHRLSIFVREEVISWHHINQKTPPEGALRDFSLQNVDAVVQRAKLLSCAVEREEQPVGSVPVNQTILELLAQATNPSRLAQMDPLHYPWL